MFLMWNISYGSLSSLSAWLVIECIQCNVLSSELMAELDIADTTSILWLVSVDSGVPLLCYAYESHLA